MSGLMKWPGTADKPIKPDLSKLSDDELDDLIVAAGLMDQDELDRQRDSRLMIVLANLPDGPPEYLPTLRGLMRLRDQGPFPLEAQDMYDRLRSRAMSDVKAAHKVAPKTAPSPADVPADMSVADWLRARWSSADEAVRNALQAVASTVGISIPMSRTRTQPIPPKDSSSTRRTESALQLTHDEQAPTERPAEAEEPEEAGYHDPPEWNDELADGWTPCESLHDAFRSDTEWY